MTQQKDELTAKQKLEFITEELLRIRDKYSITLVEIKSVLNNHLCPDNIASGKFSEEELESCRQAVKPHRAFRKSDLDSAISPINANIPTTNPNDRIFGTYKKDEDVSIQRKRRQSTR